MLRQGRLSTCEQRELRMHFFLCLNMQSPRFRICTHPNRPYTCSSPWLLLLSAAQRLCHGLGPINHRLQGSTTRPRTPLHGETERQLNHQSADHLASHRVCHSSSDRCGMVLESMAYLCGSSSTCRTVSSVEYFMVDVFIWPDNGWRGTLLTTPL